MCSNGIGEKNITIILMSKCNWLTVKELIKYFTITEMWRNINFKSPRYFSVWFKLDMMDILRH